MKIIEADQNILNQNRALASLIEKKRKEMLCAALELGMNHNLTIQRSQELDKLISSILFNYEEKYPKALLQTSRNR